MQEATVLGAMMGIGMGGIGSALEVFNEAKAKPGRQTKGLTVPMSRTQWKGSDSARRYYR